MASVTSARIAAFDILRQVEAGGYASAGATACNSELA
jgi:hypothetical protein